MFPFAVEKLYQSSTGCDGCCALDCVPAIRITIDAFDLLSLLLMHVLWNSLVHDPEPIPCLGTNQAGSDVAV